MITGIYVQERGWFLIGVLPENPTKTGQVKYIEREDLAQEYFVVGYTNGGCSVIHERFVIEILRGAK